MPTGPPVIVRPPAEPRQVAPIFVPPPGVVRPESPSRISSSSSSSSSSDYRIYRTPYRQESPRRRRTPPRGRRQRTSPRSRRRRTSPSSRGYSSSRTPPPAHTIIHVMPQPATTMIPTAPTMMPPQSVVGLPGPPINIVAPSPPSTPEPARSVWRAIQQRLRGKKAKEPPP